MRVRFLGVGFDLAIKFVKGERRGRLSIILVQCGARILASGAICGFGHKKFGIRVAEKRQTRLGIFGGLTELRKTGLVWYIVFTKLNH